VLAGLARDTRSIHLGALVSPVTFRLPGNLAKLVMTVHEMSGGRIELGLGAGWNDDEHRQYGFPFPPIGTRAEMLEEQLEIVEGLWDKPDGWNFTGRHYAIEGARFAPKPEPGRRPRIIVGGEGTRRSTRIAARFADEFNITSSAPDRIVERYGWLDEACRAIGRDPATLTRSALVGVMIAADAAGLERRADAMLDRIGRPAGGDDPAAWLAARRPRWIMGTYDEARAAVRRFEAAGVQRIMLQDLLPWDLEMIEEMGRELLGRGTAGGVEAR
jgi:alkanesulfonate monooxygenase SsuD/methylene tetrahydromethanopterin reductase-like flavin-dependent oxidoreductase (luciferase family)